jgi:hypothetical protein
MLYMSEADVRMLLDFATYRAAGAARIRPSASASNADVLTELSERAPELAAALRQFLPAYRAWYDFHVRVEQEKKGGALSANELEHFTQLIQARDSSRNRFIDALQAAEREVPA